MSEQKPAITHEHYIMSKLKESIGKAVVFYFNGSRLPNRVAGRLKSYRRELGTTTPDCYSLEFETLLILKKEPSSKIREILTQAEKGSLSYPGFARNASYWRIDLKKDIKDIEDIEDIEGIKPIE